MFVNNDDIGRDLDDSGVRDVIIQFNQRQHVYCLRKIKRNVYKKKLQEVQCEGECFITNDGDLGNYLYEVRDITDIHI